MRLVREVLAFAALAFQIGMVGFLWSGLPDRIPKHYGITGTPDAFGGKSMVLLIPAITLGLYALLTIAGFFPQRLNYPVAVTDANREKLHGIAIALLGWLKAEMALLFLYITWIDIQVGRGVSTGLGWACLPLALAVMGVTLGAGVAQMRRL